MNIGVTNFVNILKMDYCILYTYIGVTSFVNIFKWNPLIHPIRMNIGVTNFVNIFKMGPAVASYIPI